MEMHQVRYFLALCEELNFTRAAEQLHIAQQPLSAAIARLCTVPPALTSVIARASRVAANSARTAGTCRK